MRLNQKDSRLNILPEALDMIDPESDVNLRVKLHV